jgi:hypothetical protein
VYFSGTTIYHEVLEDQATIAAAVKETFEAHNSGKGVNSIVKLLALSAPAAIPEINAPEASANIQQLILSELCQFRDELRSIRRDSKIAAHRTLRGREIAPDIERIKDLIMHAEVLLRSADEGGFERAEMSLSECKQRLRHIMPQRNDDVLDMRHRDTIMELTHRIDMLEYELEKRRTNLPEKNK